MAGGGKLSVSGPVTREPVRVAFDYFKANAGRVSASTPRGRYLRSSDFSCMDGPYMLTDIRYIVEPSFDFRPHGVEVRLGRDRADERAQAHPHVEWRPGLQREGIDAPSIGLSSDVTRSLRAAAAQVVAMPMSLPDACSGLDGTTHTLALRAGGLELRFRWWEKLPADWCRLAPLVSLLEKLPEFSQSKECAKRRRLNWQARSSSPQNQRTPGDS